MSTFIILARSRGTANALQAYLSIVSTRHVCPSGTEYGYLLDPVIWTDDEMSEREAYRVLANELAVKAVSSHDVLPVGEVTVLVDEVNLAQLDPIANNGWNSVLAMLILTFPEVRWLFGVVFGGTETNGDRIAEAHGLAAMCGPAIDPLFDGTGLREWVRSRARLAHGDRTDAVANLARRSIVAIAIDDEPKYAYFHAYAAYRYRFRSFVAVDEATVHRLTGRGGFLEDAGSLQLSIEDLFLDFADRSLDEYTNTEWSDLASRSAALPALNRSDVKRVFVTVGTPSGATREFRVRNQGVCDCLRREGRLGRTVHKPTSGILQLWQSAGLTRAFQGGTGVGQARGIGSPKGSDGAAGSITDRHSVPGRLLEVATRLSNRAEQVLNCANSAIRAVQGAVLALDATELLCERGPTTLVESLALKHECEAAAECHFYGIEASQDVKMRLADIQHEVQALGEQYGAAIRSIATWNAEIAILNRLTRTYQNHNRFDEVLAVGVRGRVLHRRLWFKKAMGPLGDTLRWTNPLYWSACYVHSLLKSIPLFLVAILGWIVVLSALFMITASPISIGNARRGVQDALTSFFSVGAPLHDDENGAVAPPTAPPPAQTAGIDAKISTLQTAVDSLRSDLEVQRKSPGYAAVVCLAIVAGFLHVGIFISHLYSIASRK